MNQQFNFQFSGSTCQWNIIFYIISIYRIASYQMHLMIEVKKFED